MHNPLLTASILLYRCVSEGTYTLPLSKHIHISTLPLEVAPNLLQKVKQECGSTSAVIAPHLGLVSAVLVREMQVSKLKAAGHWWWQCQEVSASSCSTPAKGVLYPAWSALRSWGCILSMEPLCCFSYCSHSVSADCELLGHSVGSKDYI